MKFAIALSSVLAASMASGALIPRQEDPQTSLTLDPGVIATAFANDGQDVPAAGQVPSLTSTNNFINHCRTVPNLPITNGQQISSGSCNPAPIGIIPSVDNMPSSKFTFPKNGATIPANQAFTITMAIQKMQTGAFTNAQKTYFAAPQILNGNGLIIGHSHVVVDALQSLDQTTPTDPRAFTFFKGLNEAAQGGILKAELATGLPAGAYRLCSINSSANHQPVIVPVAQHGSLDDCIYFTASADANVGAQNGGAQNGGAQNGGAQNGGAQNGGAQNGGAQNGGAQNGGAQNGGAQNGGAQNGGAQNAGAQNGGAQNAGAQNGGAQNGGAQNGGAQNGGAQNAGAQNGGAQNGGAQNAGAQNGGAQNGGAQNNNGTQNGQNNRNRFNRFGNFRGGNRGR